MVLVLDSMTPPRRSRVRRRDVVGQPLARQFFISQALGQSADALTAVILAGVVLSGTSDGVDPSRLLGVLAMAVLPYAVAGPLSGVIADHWDRRRTLVVANLARCGLTAVVFLSVHLSSRTLGLVAAGALLSAARLVYTLRAASLPQTVSRESLVAADSVALIVGTLASTLGGAIGALAPNGTATLLLVVAAAAQLCSAAGFGTLSNDLGGRSAEVARASLIAVVSRVSALLATGPTRFAIVATSGHRALLGASFVTLVLVTSNDYGLDGSGYVAALGITGTGSFLGSFTALRGWALLGPRRFVLATYGLPALALFVAATFPHPAIVIVSLAASFFVFQNLRIITDACVQLSIADDARARVFSIYDAVYNLSYFAGAVLAIWFNAGSAPSVAFLSISSAFGVGLLIVTTRSASLALAPTSQLQPGAVHIRSAA